MSHMAGSGGARVWAAQRPSARLGGTPAGGADWREGELTNRRLSLVLRRGKTQKMTEEEEDRAMAEAAAHEARQVRLTVQPACASSLLHACNACADH